jgi:hypothetical protein
MNDKGVLRFAYRLVSVPREKVVRAAPGESVVAGRENSVIVVNDASANLSARVLGALSGKQSNSHKIFVPAYVAISFTGHISILRDS